jgi:hypothetical protein
MASSFVSYRGAGFWANDGVIGVWLRLLVREIDGHKAIPAWLAELREHWLVQARFGGGGSIDSGLDEYLIDDPRRNIVLSVIDGAFAQIVRYGGTISRDELNSITADAHGMYWTIDLPTGSFEAVGRAFGALLRGEITMNAVTAPVIR